MIYSPRDYCIAMERSRKCTIKNITRNELPNNIWEEAQIDPTKRKHTAGIFDRILTNRNGEMQFLYIPKDATEEETPE